MIASRQYFQTVYFIARQSFLNSIAFRAAFFTSFFIELAFIFLSILLWTAIAQGSDSVGGRSIQELITYMGIARLIVPIDMDFVTQVQQRVLSGEIISDFLRPVKTSFLYFSQEVGRYLHRLFLHVLPIYSLVYVIVGINLPSNLTTLLLFLISICLSFILMFYINYLTSLMAFWITQLFSLNVIKGQTVRFLSGYLVPLWIFPASFIEFLKYLPFASVVFIPIEIYLGKLETTTIAIYLSLQIGWIVVFIFLSGLVLKKATNKIAINGG